MMTANHKVVSRDDWVEARKQFLAKEKQFTRLRDELSQERRQGNRVKGSCGDEACEEVVVPGGGFSPEA
jgi:hypothetical protein